MARRQRMAISEEHELASEVAAIRAQVQALANIVESLARKVENISVGQRPQLGVMAAWATVILTIVGVAGNGYVIRPMERIEASLLSNLTRIDSDARERSAANTSRVKDLDDKLQREARDLDATIMARLNALDDKLQMEIRHERALTTAQADSNYWRIRYEHVTNGQSLLPLPIP